MFNASLDLRKPDIQMVDPPESYPRDCESEIPEPYRVAAIRRKINHAKTSVYTKFLITGPDTL